MKTALQLDPRLADAHYHTGIVYLESNDLASAEQEFHAELRLQPTHTLATYHLAYALLTEGHSKDSVPLFREVIKKRPQDELAHFELGRALLEQGEIDGAIQSLEVAKKLVPDHNAVYYMLSRAYRRAGRTQEAAEALATYQKLTEENRLKKRKSMETQTPEPKCAKSMRAPGSNRHTAGNERVCRIAAKSRRTNANVRQLAQHLLSLIFPGHVEFRCKRPCSRQSGFLHQPRNPDQDHRANKRDANPQSLLPQSMRGIPSRPSLVHSPV